MTGALLAAFTGLWLGSPATAQDNYVPAGIGRQTADGGVYERHLGATLRAMGEPILSGPDGRGRFGTRLRLLVVPDRRGNPFVIRIDGTEGGGQVSVVQLHGTRPGNPGRVSYRRYYRLTPAEMQDVRRLIRETGLLSAPSEAAAASAVSFTRDGRQIVTLCAHPPTFAFELAQASGSHFVVRDACELDREPALRALADELLDLDPRRRRETR